MNNLSQIEQEVKQEDNLGNLASLEDQLMSAKRAVQFLVKKADELGVSNMSLQAELAEAKKDNKDYLQKIFDLEQIADNSNGRILQLEDQLHKKRNG